MIFGNFVLTFRSFLERTFKSEDDEKKDDEEKKDDDEKNAENAVNMMIFTGQNIPKACSIVFRHRGKAGKCAG